MSSVTPISAAVGKAIRQVPTFMVQAGEATPGTPVESIAQMLDTKGFNKAAAEALGSFMEVTFTVRFTQDVALFQTLQARVVPAGPIADPRPSIALMNALADYCRIDRSVFAAELTIDDMLALNHWVDAYHNSFYSEVAANWPSIISEGNEGDQVAGQIIQRVVNAATARAEAELRSTEGGE